MRRVTAVLLAAGKGVRLRSAVPKPLVRIGNKPMVLYSLETFQKHPGVDDIVLVTSRELVPRMEALVRRHKVGKVRCVVAGGKERQDSVRNGIACVQGKGLVAVHDCARPLFTAKVLSSLILAASRNKAAIVAVPVKATVKQVADGKVLSSLDRRNLWEVQTPQVFDVDVLKSAFERYGSEPVTDDAMLVEKMGVPVCVVEGSYRNLKVTTPEDVIMAQTFLKVKG